MRASWPKTVSPGPAGKSRVVMLIVCHVWVSGMSNSMRWLWKSVVLCVLTCRFTRRGAWLDRIRASTRSSYPGSASRERSIPSDTLRLMSAHQMPRRSWVASTRIEA
jgi:hypothetical protein